MPPVTKRVLVTGGSGFIGRHVVPLLQERGYEVFAPTRADFDVLDAESVSHALRDLTPSHVLHCAWIATPGIYHESPENERWKDASLHLFQEAIRYGATRIVGAGSCFEYAWQATPCIEDLTPTVPTTFYGRCKNDCRLSLMALAEEKGISAAWGRVFFLYGPGEPEQKLVASVILSLLRGETAACTHGRQVRDVSYVKDVAAGFVALLESDIRGPVNIASGEAIALKDLITIAARQLDAEDRVVFGAREAPAHEPPVITADIMKLLSTGWTRTYSHNEGLRETIEWWRGLV